ncbi:MAG: hypothetical protein BWY78_00517 [Alphaproteobacteria bacterium ADurb.Bin438]|nr:MAG: hypothetical protein BWY78_00517 [Alphaproteobacteria bacterium ADurb.Bin438]
MSRKNKGEGTVLLSRLLLIGILLVLSQFFLPSLIFLFFALIPTILSYITDHSKIRYKWLCVGSLNTAGAMPYLFMLWFNDNSFSSAIELAFDMGHLSIMYGAAFAGFLIYIIVPPAVASYVQASNQKRLVNLKDSLQRLIDVWGEGVTLNEENIKSKKK